MRASVDFYVGGLGARIVSRWEPEGELRWCRLELGDSALMLQTFGPALRQRDPASRLGLGVSLAFQCADAIALYRGFRAGGLDASEPFAGNGLWNTSVTDTDGYVLEFCSPADVPEETRFSEVQKPFCEGAEPQLFVLDLAASCEYYTKTLGFSVAFTYGTPPFYAQVVRDNARLNLRQVEAVPMEPGLREREDLLSATVTLTAAGALFSEYRAAGVQFHHELKEEPWGARTFSIRDPDGNLVLFSGDAS
jgi:catechol 2,3-dioxygenase-like lactoylglutathione lyase family enzyme